MPLPPKKLLPGILLGLMLVASAAPPLWWSTGNPPVIAPAAEENNHGPANIGQAKHIAKSALDTLRPIRPDVTALIEADLAPILDFTVPDPKTLEWIEKQKAPLLIGQLKAIADPFYTRLHAAAPDWLAAERTENGTNHPNSIFPWTPVTTDDANKAIANIGQLKAVFSLRFDTMPPPVPLDTDVDGMPDDWEIENGLNPNDPADANQDNDGDGLTNAQELADGRDPNSADIWGPVNADFRDFVQPGALMSFRDEYPSDLYYGDDIVGWQANEGDYIEIWQEDDDATPEPDDGDRYIELQSHLDAHGVKQEFPMLSESRMTFILRYKGRYETEASHNAFELKVEGAAKLTVDGTEVTEDNGVRTHLFTDTEEWQEWQIAVITITAPEDEAGFSNVTLSLVPDETEYGGEHITHGGFVSLLPVKVVEVLPKIVDENNVEIPNADKPANSPKSTEMVERAPLETPTALTDASAIRIAWRDMKVKIGKGLAGKKVTWTMTPQFTPSVVTSAGPPEVIGPDPSGPRFRGKWGTAANATYRHRFSASEKYGDHDYKSLTQMLEADTNASVTINAQTKVDDDGYTAIRVNLPPISFNKARIKIEIEGITEVIDLIDLEVPAVVVIDPGHGGTVNLLGSSANNATSPTGVKEKDLALSYGLALSDALKAEVQQDKLNVKVLMTRKLDENVSGTDRAHFARNNGTDVVFVIHFNADSATVDSNGNPRTPHLSRGTLEVRQIPSQVNLDEDVALIDPIISSIVAAITPFDAAANKRYFVATDTSVAFDPKLGNTYAYSPIRVGYCEVEFLDNAAADVLLNTGPNAGAVKTAIVNAVRDGILLDLKIQPAQP